MKMTHFLELNLAEFNINQEFMRIIPVRPSTCVCCLAKNAPFIKLINCKHVSFFETFFQDKMDYLETLLCYQCHGFLMKFELFKQQVEENLPLFNDQQTQQMAMNRKFGNLQKIPTYFLSVGESQEPQPIEMLTSLISSIDAPSPQEQPTSNDCKYVSTNATVVTMEHNYQLPVIVSVKSEQNNQEPEFETDIKIEHESCSDVEEIDIPLSEIKKGKRKQQKRGVIKPEVQHIRYKGMIKIITLTNEQLMAERDKDRLQERYQKLPHKCENCITAFDHEILLKEHIDKKHTMKPGGTQCDICKSVSGNDASYKEHFRRHFRRYECEACGKRNNTLQAVLTHYSLQHEALGTVYHCTECDYTTESYRQFRYHRIKHSQPVECPQCGKSFISAHGLKTHTLIIHGKSNRVYSCEQCGKVYHHKSALRAHLESTHSRTGGAYCVPCKKHFNTHKALAHHMKSNSRHIDDTAKKYICNDCGKRYLHKFTLQEHINWHHMKCYTHACKICPKAFLRKTQLRRHIQVVHEKKVAPRDKICHHCGRGFTTNAILSCHVRTHTGERPLRCPRCPATFAHTAARYTHVRFVHDRRARGHPPHPP